MSKCEPGQSAHQGDTQTTDSHIDPGQPAVPADESAQKTHGVIELSAGGRRGLLRLRFRLGRLGLTVAEQLVGGDAESPGQGQQLVQLRGGLPRFP